MNFEEALSAAGGFSRFQLWLTVLLLVPRLVLPWHLMVNNFISATPHHRCRLPDSPTAAPLDNGSGPAETWGGQPPWRDDDEEGLSACSLREAAGTNASESPRRNSSEAVPCPSGWEYDRRQFTETVVTQWDLVCEHKALNHLSLTLFMAGVMLGSLVFGYLSDRYGRRNALLGSYVLNAVTGTAAAWAPSFSSFTAMRFLLGVSLSGIIVNTLSLSVEWLDQGHRTFAGTSGGFAWSTGNMALGLLAYLLRGWQQLQLVVTSPIYFCILTWWFIPESPRWLLVRGRAREAHRNLSLCARINGRTKFGSEVTVEALQDAVEKERTTQNSTFLHLFRSPRMRKHTLAAGVVWFCTTLTYYGISLNVSGVGLDMYTTQFVFGAIEVPAKIIIYVLLERIGRRPCQAGTLLATGALLALSISVPAEMSLLKSLAAIAGKGTAEAAFTTAYLHAVEIFPTSLRQNGLGYVCTMARLGGTVAPLAALLADAWPSLPGLLYSAVAFVGGLAALLLPETRGAELPETLSDVENDARWPGGADGRGGHGGHGEGGACDGMDLGDDARSAGPPKEDQVSLQDLTPTKPGQDHRDGTSASADGGRHRRLDENHSTDTDRGVRL
ncbi:solute carrier family 22 member 7 [Petromyzon marinus]|uniref:solute carrier family 22 member 7 n=1 Tax=Petromyzon marinus TaxID=7757 RepID=UPI003F716089